jgi:hypothetical protein
MTELIILNLSTGNALASSLTEIPQIHPILIKLSALHSKNKYCIIVGFSTYSTQILLISSAK